MAPILFTGLVVGVTVAVIQAATQVNEPTLTFIPKIIAVGMVSGAVLPCRVCRMVPAPNAHGVCYKKTNHLLREVARESQECFKNRVSHCDLAYT